MSEGNRQCKGDDPVVGWARRIAELTSRIIMLLCALLKCETMVATKLLSILSRLNVKRFFVKYLINSALCQLLSNVRCYPCVTVIYYDYQFVTTQ